MESYYNCIKHGFEGILYDAENKDDRKTSSRKDAMSWITSIWFDDSPVALIGKNKAKKVFDEVFSNLKSCDVTNPTRNYGH